LWLAILTALSGVTPAFSATRSEGRAAHHRPAQSATQSAAQSATQSAAQSATQSATQVGTASHYGRGRAGRLTASGERFDPEAMTCAHKTLPLGSVVKVTDIATGKHVSVKVNDRGPYVRGRIVDLSDKAARELGAGDKGLLHVSVEVTSIGQNG
jgi:rare lipoprotein A